MLYRLDDIIYYKNLIYIFGYISNNRLQQSIKQPINMAIYQRIRENALAGKNPLRGIDADATSLEEVVAVLKNEFATLCQIWRICNSAIRHYEDEEMESVQDDREMTNIILNNTSRYWAILSPAWAQIRKHTTDLESRHSSMNFNELAFYANEAMTIRRVLMAEVNRLTFHPAGIIGKSDVPFDALSAKSCFE